MRNFMEKIKNPDLFKKIRDYQMEYLPVFRKKSINSNKSAVSTMNIFIDFLVTIKKRDPFSLDFSDFGSKSINDFIKYQKEEKKLAPTTINLRLSNLRSFNYYLYKRNYISLSEFSEIQEIKQMPDFREKVSISDSASVVSWVKTAHHVIDRSKTYKSSGRRSSNSMFSCVNP